MIEFSLPRACVHTQNVYAIENRKRDSVKAFWAGEYHVLIIGYEMVNLPLLRLSCTLASVLIAKRSTDGKPQRGT